MKNTINKIKNISILISLALAASACGGEFEESTEDTLATNAQEAIGSTTTSKPSRAHKPDSSEKKPDREGVIIEARYDIGSECIDHGTRETSTNPTSPQVENCCNEAGCRVTTEVRSAMHQGAGFTCEVTVCDCGTENDNPTMEDFADDMRFTASLIG